MMISITNRFINVQKKTGLTGRPVLVIGCMRKD